MLGIPLGLLYANAGEWFIHRYVLHGLGKKKTSFWSFHWGEHHRAARKHDFLDPDYERSVFGNHAQGKEALAVVGLMLAHAPLFRLNHIHDGTEINQTFEWPMLPDGDASKLAGLPTRRGWKVFSTEPIESEVTVRYPTRGRTVQIAYDTEDDQPAFWGIWINNGGWNNHRHFAIEPTTGRFDELDRSIKDGSAGRVEPMGRREWSVRWVLA